MQTACRLSRRWHQQFCQSPSFASRHRDCMQHAQHVREYRQTLKARPTRSQAITDEPNLESSSSERPSNPFNNNIVVREYELDKNDTSKLHQVDPSKEIKDEMAKTRGELVRLEQDLIAMKQGPFGPNSKLMKSLPADERNHLLQALAEEGILQDQQEDMLTLAELERMSQASEKQNDSMKRRLGVALRIPRKDQAYARHFNLALQKSQDAEMLDIQKNLNLWRWYLRCQQQIHNFSDMITDEVWQILWRSQAQLKLRPQHLVMLARDMIEAKIVLDKEQWLDYMDALRTNGDVITAVNIWQEQKPHFKTICEHSARFWALGVFLYADLDRPQKAHELAFSALNRGRINAEVFVSVIAVWARSSDPDALTKAWASYLQMKARLGHAMSAEIYERTSNAFLDADKGDMALSVFKDMLLSQDHQNHDSTSIYRQVTKHVGDALESATTEAQINRVGLSALLVLPRKYQNRFFFASWIKKLIGEKRVDSAAMVVELMYERGIAPDAKPLNGIIGAWLRDGSISSRKKAQEMAWSMIETRADVVQERKRTSSSQNKIYREIEHDTSTLSFQRRTPSATIETFSILLQHYTRRQDNEQAEKLTDVMVNECDIQPNSYIMNHWLYKDLRAGRIHEVWNKYCNLKNEITPDLETFAALWDTTKVQMSKADANRTKYFPSAREVFAEMKDWLSGLSPNKSRNAINDFSSELYEQIIRCFCLSTDLPGTLLAIHHLASMFDIYPTDNALRLVCGQAARLLPTENRVDIKAIRRRRSGSRYTPVMSQVAEIIQSIEATKKDAMVEDGADFGALQDPATESAQRLRLAVLTEFICMFMQRAQAKHGSVRNDLNIAARTMHVEVGDIDLSRLSDQ